jgi:hypothetical protein
MGNGVLATVGPMLAEPARGQRPRDPRVISSTTTRPFSEVPSTVLLDYLVEEVRMFGYGLEQIVGVPADRARGEPARLKMARSRLATSVIGPAPSSRCPEPARTT